MGALRTGFVAAVVGLALAGASAAGARFGNWNVELDGEEILAGVASDRGAVLYLACASDGRLVALVDYGEALSIEDSLPVRWRVDSGAVQAQRWTVLERRSILATEPALAGRAFLKTLQGGRHFALEAGGRRDVFDVFGVLQVSAVLDCAKA